MPRFRDLPVVLQNLCTDFAWETPFRLVTENLDVLLLIKSMNMPPMFFRPCLFHQSFCCHIHSPLEVYTPFWAYSELFNIYRIKELLYNLDFRKRNVKSAGTRFSWMNSFDKHYVNILYFGMFYKILLASGQNIWTPTYNQQLRTGQGATHYI